MGRTAFGIANLALKTIVRYLVDFIEDQDAPLPTTDVQRYQVVRLCVDDQKAFFYEASLAQPGNAIDLDLANWYYGETVVSGLLIKVNLVCAATDDLFLKNISIRGIIPVHQAHRKK